MTPYDRHIAEHYRFIPARQPRMSPEAVQALVTLICCLLGMGVIVGVCAIF